MPPIMTAYQSAAQFERPVLCKVVEKRLLSGRNSRLMASQTLPSVDLCVKRENLSQRGRAAHGFCGTKEKALTLGTLREARRGDSAGRGTSYAAWVPTVYGSECDLSRFQRLAKRRAPRGGLSGPKEHDLEQKLDVELRIREGTARLLAACKHPSQNLEAAKALRVSNARMAALRTELQLRGAASGGSSNHRNAESAVPCRGKVSVSELRLPLMWKETDHFKNRGDYRRFAVFCVASVGTEVQDTELVTPVDRSMTDITFTDTLYFPQMSPDFAMNVEVYACVLQDDLALASTPRKISRTLHSSITRTLGRKMAAKLKDGGGGEEPGPKFELVASCSLKLADANDAIKSHDLSLENLENAHSQLPLFGQFCLRLAAQPDAFTDVTEGPVQYQNRSGYAKLHGFTWQWWAKEADKDQGNEPELSVQINQFTSVMSENKPALKLVQKDKVFALEFSGKRDVEKWNRAFAQCLLDFKSWGRAAEECMEIQSPVQIRRDIFSRERHGSLYEQTPIHDGSLACIPERRQVRPALSDLFATPLPPSHSADFAPTTPCLPATRPRSLSSSTASLKSWGSIKGMWPFTKSSD